MTTVVQYALGGCLLLCFLQSYLAGAQECRTCYRSLSYQATRLTSRRTSQRTRCYIFFRCTTYRTVYQTGTYTAYRAISYCCRGTGSIGNGALRLRGGPSESHGRLEIYYNAQWGTVCDDSFGSYDAEVACMQLGFAGHSASIQEFGGGSDPIWLDDVGCVGTETWLPNCTSSNWGIHNCAHTEDVGVKCNSALQIRLVGGGSNPFSGRVEYYLQGIWATVCDDYFGTADGNVVCNQLGYGNATGTPSFGAGSGSIAFDDLDCSGDEISLLFCPHLGNFEHNCGHNEDVGVTCEGPKPTITTVRASSSLSVFLEWEMPWQLKYQTFIRGYRVQYGTSTRVYALRTLDVSTTSTSASATISSLVQGTTYYFRVALKASESQFGPYSGFVTATTSGAPKALMSMNATPASATSVRVSWAYSADPSTLTIRGGYRIQYRAVSPPGLSDAGNVTVTRLRSSYIVYGLEEGVRYKVTVNAYVGSTSGVPMSTYVSTYTAAPTGPPQNVRASRISSYSVQVAWIPPQLHLQNGHLSGYKVSCSPSPSGSTSSVSTSSSSFSATVTGLTPYTQYSCNVAAQNQNGTGPYSDSSVVVTAEAAPTGAPVSVRALTTGSTTVHLQWSPPPSNTINGVPLDYVISYWLANSGNSQTRVTTSDTRTRYEFTNLKPYTAYSFRVAIRNSIGTGPYSLTKSTVTATDVPSAPPQSVSAVPESSFSIRVAWREPPVQQRNGPITSYAIVYGVHPTLEPAQSSLIRTVASSHLLTQLSAYKEYYIKVAASTNNGTGPYSTIDTAKTFAHIPSGSPSIVSLTADENQAILTLSWTPPAENSLNGPLSGISYRIRYGVLGEQATELHVNSTSTSGSSIQQHVLSNLEYGTTYFAQVAAESSNGTGPYSTAFTKTTVSTKVKNPPQNVTVVVLGAYSIRVTWSPPEHDGNDAPITGYRVVYGQIDTGTSHSTATTALSAVLERLAPFTNYFVRVAAMREEEIGVYSNDVFVQTRSAAPTGSPREISLQVHARHISVTWKPPARGEANGPVTGFEIRLEHNRQERNRRTVGKRAAIGLKQFTVAGHLTTHTIEDLEPYENYCLQMAASNINGTGPFSIAECFKTLQDVPGPIASVNISTVSSTELNVSWTPPTSPNGIILNYVFAYTSAPEQNIPHKGELTARSNLTSVVLNGLYEGVQYHLRMWAVTVVGPGPELTAEGTTYTAAPTAPPGVVQLFPQSANSILVNWTLPPLVDRNGPISGYAIRYREANKEAFSGRHWTVGSVLFFQVENLQPYTDYSVQVAAVNVNGTGPFSTFQDTKTLSALPGTPENLTALNTSTQQIRVMWDPPSSPNGILQGYKLTYAAIKPQGVPGNASLETSETAVELEGLLEGVTYMIAVAAVNEVGVGDTATTEQATTPAIPESPPTNFSIINIGKRSIDLTWGPPQATLRNGPLVQYVVVYGIQGGTIETTQKLRARDLNILEHEAVVHTVEQLTPFTTYFFKVAFANSVGESGFTEKLVNMTLPDVPSSVRNLTVTSIGEGFVIIQWLPPEASYGSITSYQILVNEEEVQIISYSELLYNVSNLTCGISYTIGVSAGNSAGHSRVNQIEILHSKMPGDLDSTGREDETIPLCGPNSVGDLNGSGVNSLQHAEYAVIGAMVVVAVVIVIAIVLFCICCVRRYRKMKAAVVTTNADEKSTAEHDDGSPIYEEIPFDSKLEACGDENDVVAQSERPRCENAYTVHPGEVEFEGCYDCPIVHDPDGSIKDGDIYIEDVNGVSETVHVSSSREKVYYNTSAKKDGTALAGADSVYDVPKSNMEAPQEMVAAELGGQSMASVDCMYEVMHSPETLESK